MSRFDERLQQDFDHIADRATPSDSAWEAIQTRIAEQAPITETEIIMLDTNPDPQRRSRTSAWLLRAAAAAVLIVGTMLALSRSNDEPAAVFAGDDIEATEVTEEAPDVEPVDDLEKPVPVEALSPTVTFDGEDCVYEGPDEFDAGSEVTFTLVDVSDTRSVGVAVWALAPGTTAEEILDRGIFNRGAQIPESASAEITDSGIRVTYLLSDAGPYAINCADRPDGGPAVDYATVFAVGE